MSQQSGKLTRRQQEIQNFIHLSVRRIGYPPTRADICNHFGFRSPNAAAQHLRALERKAVIRVEKGTSRGIRLLEPVSAAPALASSSMQAAVAGLHSLPLIGRVAAGSPVLARRPIVPACGLAVDRRGCGCRMRRFWVGCGSGVWGPADFEAE